MVDRLGWNQVAAPDFSASARLMAGAGDAWQQAMGTLSGGLERAGDRQKTRLSNGALLPLANVGSDQEAAAALAALKIDPNNITPEAMAQIMATRGRGMDMDTARMNNNNTGSQIGYRDNQSRILGNQDARTGQIHDRTMQSEDDMIALTGQYNDAYYNAQQGNYGAQGNPLGTAGANVTNEDTFGGFMGTVQEGGLTNPFGLAAVASTVQRESGFDPKNGNRTWSDPSESGVEGTSGGYMSLRDDRYKKMVAFTGGDMSPQAQAAYFMKEDPSLITRLQGAKSVEEAQQMMNEAWKFAGYDKPNEGEAAERFATANSMLSRFGGTSGGAAPGQTGTRQASGEMLGRINIPEGARITPAQAKVLNDDIFGAWDTGVDTRDANRTQEIAQQRAQVGWETELKGLDDTTAAQEFIDTEARKGINLQERQALVANSSLSPGARTAAMTMLEDPNAFAGDYAGPDYNPYSVPGSANIDQQRADFVAQQDAAIGSNETLRAQSQARTNYGDTENPVDLATTLKGTYGDTLQDTVGDITTSITTVMDGLKAAGVNVTEADAKQLIADSVEEASRWGRLETFQGSDTVKIDTKKAIERGARLYAPEAIQAASRLQGQADRNIAQLDSFDAGINQSKERISQGRGNADYQANGYMADDGRVKRTYQTMGDWITNNKPAGYVAPPDTTGGAGSTAVDGTNRSASLPERGGNNGAANQGAPAWNNPETSNPQRQRNGRNPAPGQAAFDAAAEQASGRVSGARKAAVEATQDYIQRDPDLMEALLAATPEQAVVIKQKLAAQIMEDTSIDQGMRYQMVNELKGINP